MTNVVALSGGIDSTSLALKLLESGEKIRGIFFNLGQKSHRRQEAAVRRFGLQHDVPVEIINIPGFLDMFVGVMKPPHPMVAEAAAGPNEPCNDSCSVILSAGLYGAATGAEVLYYGASLEDVQRIKALPEMLEHIERTIQINTGVSKFRCEAPNIKRSRPEILKEMGAGISDVFTWSCHWGGLHHCGECEGCKVRQDRFSVAAIPDDTEYSKEYPA